MKKKIAAALAMVMAFSLAACSGGGGTDTPSTSNGEQENVTLRFYNYALSETAKADWWNATVEAFEAENDWIDIETVTVDYNSMIQTFTNDLASGLAVDMVYGEVSWIPALAESGFVQSPEDVLSSDFYSGYYDYVLEQMKYNDTVYAVPHYYSPSLIFVNKELVEAAGLSIDSFPTTLDGLK